MIASDELIYYNFLQERDIEGTKIVVLLVKEQKRKTSGKPAGVVFSEAGFKVLQYYIEHLLKEICRDKFNQYVFPRRSNCQIGKPISLQEHLSILQRKEVNGKRISSRSIRGTYVTLNRSSNASVEQRQDLADSMNHTLPVANS